MSPRKYSEFHQCKDRGCGTAARGTDRQVHDRSASRKFRFEVDYGSEFRYRDPIVDSKTPYDLHNQSGETADTLAAQREAKQRFETLANL